MEIFKLLPSTYLAGDTVTFGTEDSVVWTERYLESGDFKIEVYDDISILSRLPIDTLISHTNTKEVMIVENHEIERDAEKKLKVTVTGRSFETFAEQRPTLGSAASLYTAGVANVETITGAAEEVARTLLRGRMVPGVASSADAITNLLVRTSMRDPDSSLTHVIQRGDIYTRVLELLRIANAGIKTVRPNGAQTTLDFVIHDGLDKRTTVIFYAQYEDLEDAKYFWSIRNYRNYAIIAGKATWREYKNRDVATTPTGLSKREMYVEASDLEGAYSPPTATDAMATRAQNALDDQRMISLLQAKISETAKPKFKISYDMGDLVTVFGEFATAQSMRVTEHILTIDKNGIRGYPSLSIV